MGLTYRDKDGCIYAAHAGLGGTNFYVMKTKNGDGWHRVKSPSCPERASIDEAQDDLDAWANKKGLTPVDDLTGEYAKAKKPDDNQWLVELIDTRSIRPSPVNRKGLSIIDEETIELAANLREIGMIQPVTVRPVDGGYELVCGERRWLAYQVNAGVEPGWDRIPAYVRTIDDQRAHELTVVENLQRKNLTPLEEAAGIDVLLAGGRGLEEIADALGKPVGWVARRVKLRDLTEKWKTAIADPEHGYSLWPVTHLEAVARNRPEVQDEIYALYDSRFRREISLKELQKELGRFMLALSGALWPKDQPGPGNDKTCATCGERSGCQPELFDDIGGYGVKRNDRCLNRACYGAKLEAFLLAREKELRKQHPDLKIINKADVNDGFIPSGSELSKKALQEKWKYSKVKEDSQGAFPALVIDGPGTGKIEWWALDKGYQTPKETRYDENGEKMPKTLAERRTALIKRREVKLLERAKNMVDAEIHMPERCQALGIDFMLAVIWHYRTEACCGGMKDEDIWRRIGNKDLYHNGQICDMRPLIEDIFIKALDTWSNEMRMYLTRNEPCMGWVEMVYQVFGADLAGARIEVCEEIPEPKSWAGLNEDGTPKSKAVTS